MIFAHIMDDNLGDKVCCPRDYFSFPVSCESDFRDIEMTPGYSLIIGGGGMLYPKVDEWIKTISKMRKVIVWGVGLNYDDASQAVNAKDYFKDCRLVGVRNKAFAKENGFEYVPCPSCCSPYFDKEFERKEDVGIYEHFCHPIEIYGIPRMNNYADKTFEKVIEYLGSFKKIITNSYHGAYWSKLLGVEVEIYKPFSIRFNDIPNETLKECRNLNYQFYDKVLKSI